MASAKPNYVTTGAAQLRLWQAGEGGDLIVLPGLIHSAERIATLAAEACPGWRVTVPELPGIGGSSGVDPADIEAVANALATALEWLDGDEVVIAALDLADALAPLLAERLKPRAAKLVTVGAERAAGWRRVGITPGDFAPRQDGTHLQALWSFIRDRHLLVPDDPGQPATDGEPLPTDSELSETFVAAAMRPDRYAALWQLCAAARPESVDNVERLSDLPRLLPDSARRPAATTPPATRPAPGNTIWQDYVDTRNGRIHLRRAGGGIGSGERPLLVIPTGGGSSAQFAPVITGLAQGRSVFAVDYPGNGLSYKWSEPPTIESLAADMLALIDAMEIEELDIWGSHTGSLVALELALLAPERVRRIVMEGPVFISADFQSDLLGNYFPQMTPDKWGLHIPLVWNWRRDMFMYWPWYRVDRAAARQLGVPSAWELHLYAIGILESGETYDGAYRAAFSYDTRARLPLLTRPALICAGPNDMLKNGLEEARHYVPEDLVEIRETPTTVWWPDPDPDEAEATLAVYRDFLSR